MQENNQNRENKKEEQEPVKLDGIEKLKEIGLKEVSDKTFINLENLTALLEKDFAKLNQTKALGFIQILQREFGVDLSELKKEYLQFNGADKKVKEHHKSVEIVDNDEEKSKKLLPYLLLGVAGLVALYFLFFSPKEIHDANVTAVDLNVVKNELVTKEAKESLLAVDEEESNDSEEVDLNKVVQEMFKATQEENESQESNDTLIEDNATSEIITPAKEENITLETSATREEVVVEKQLPVETKIKSVETKERLVIPKKVKKPKKVTNENRGGLFIEPIQKAWVGVIFLDTMKKKDFLIRHTLVLDANKDQIILVGHKNFKIYNKQLEQGFKSKKMVMFLYKDGELREISKREYNRYRGNARW